MSKAFTSESDHDDAAWGPSPLPPGVKNYMTPAGAAQLAEEIKRLQDEKRRLSLNDVATRARAEKIDRRLSYLVPRFEAAEVIDPRLQPRARVLFGARVTLTDDQGTSETWRIVGMDEMNPDRGDISWTSPLATALLDQPLHARVSFMKRTLTIQNIDYP